MSVPIPAFAVFATKKGLVAHFVTEDESPPIPRLITPHARGPVVLETQ